MLSRYHEIVDAIPSRNPIVGRHPSSRIMLTSSSFCIVPSGFEVSHRVSPVYPTSVVTIEAISRIVWSSPVPTLTCDAPS